MLMLYLTVVERRCGGSVCGAELAKSCVLLRLRLTRVLDAVGGWFIAKQTDPTEKMSGTRPESGVALLCCWRFFTVLGGSTVETLLRVVAV